jgi:5-methylcytosine-specific restriction endonuclease McrA
MKIKLYKDFLNEELQKIISGRSDSGKTKYIDTIFSEPSSSKSSSSGILLRKQLRDQEFDDLKNILSDEIENSFNKKGKSRSSKEEKFRITLNNLKFLKDKAKEGELHCEYCGKGPLVIYDFNPENIDSIKISNPKFRFNTKFNEKDGATCDHREPVSKGGDKFDYSNLAVSCYPCNKRKGNITYIEWLKRLNESQDFYEIDVDEIEDIMLDIKNEFDLNLSVVQMTSNRVQVILTGYIRKNITDVREFTNSLSDSIDRFNSMSYSTKLIQFGIDDKDIDSDGDYQNLNNKFRIYALFTIDES